MQFLNLHETFRFFNPKAGLYYRLNPSNALYGSVAVVRREPNRSNYTDANKNEMPRPERLTNFELGHQFQQKTWAFSANLYYMRYKDQLIMTGKVNETGRAIMTNVPDSYRMGIELTACVRLASGLDWNGNLTLSRNKIENHTEYVTVYDSNYNPEEQQQADYYGTTNISFSPGVITNSLFTFRHRSFTAGLQSNYVGKQYLDNTGRTDANLTQSRKKERSIDAYFVNNLRLSYDFPWNGGRQMTVQLSVNNLFNEKYETNGWLWSCYYRQAGGSLEPYTEKSYFPQAGIHWMANVSLRF
jgi:iron complex outermembrane receptor protein